MMQELEFEEVEKHFAGKPWDWRIHATLGLLCVAALAYHEPPWWVRIIGGFAALWNGLLAGYALRKSIEKENTK